MPSGYLIHYASPYYDPVKAHEYYMDHRELKGRRSTSGLNEEGRKVASYVKSRINEERNTNVESNLSELKGNISSIQEAIIQLKSLSKSAKEAKRSEIKANIEDLRNQAKEKKAMLKAALEEKRLEVRSNIEGRKSDSKSDREALNETIKKRTERDKNETDSIRAQMKALGSGKANAQKRAELQERINEINEDRKVDNASDRQELAETNLKRKAENDSDREELSAMREYTSKTSKEISNDLRDKSNSLRNELRQFNTDTSTLTREKVNEMRSAIKDLRAESKVAIQKIRDDADATYESELNKIKSESKYLSKSRR